MISTLIFKKLKSCVIVAINVRYKGVRAKIDNSLI